MDAAEAKQQALGKALVAAEEKFNASGGPAKLQALFAKNPSLKSELATQVSRATGLKLKAEYFDITPQYGFNKAFDLLSRIGRQGVYRNLPQSAVDNAFWAALSYFATLLVGTCMTTTSCVYYDAAVGILYGVSTEGGSFLAPASALGDLVTTYLKNLLNFTALCLTGFPYYPNEDGTVSKDPISDLARLFACLIALTLGAPVIAVIIWLILKFPPPMNPPFSSITADSMQVRHILGGYDWMFFNSMPALRSCVAGVASAFDVVWC